MAAVAVNAPLWLPAYQALIEAKAPFPPDLHAADGPVNLQPVPAGFPPNGRATHSPAAVSTGLAQAHLSLRPKARQLR